MVRGDIMREKFRNSLEKREPFAPGKPAQVGLPMLECFHIFKAGHGLMVQVQRSWFALYDRNPQVFISNIAKEKRGEFQKATQTHSVRSAAFPYRIAGDATNRGEKMFMKRLKN